MEGKSQDMLITNWYPGVGRDEGIVSAFHQNKSLTKIRH